MSGFKPPILFCRIPCNPGLLSRGARKPSATSVLAFAKACEFTVCARFIIEVFAIKSSSAEKPPLFRPNTAPLHPHIPTQPISQPADRVTFSLRHRPAPCTVCSRRRRGRGKKQKRFGRKGPWKTSWESFVCYFVPSFCLSCDPVVGSFFSLQ